MEGNYALRLIKRADYCALTSSDTGLDVAHVVYSLMYVHVAWSWPVAVARAAYSRAFVRRRVVQLSRAGPGPGAPGELDHRVPRCLSSAVYVLDVGPWPQLSAASAARVAA